MLFGGSKRPVVCGEEVDWVSYNGKNEATQMVYGRIANSKERRMGIVKANCRTKEEGVVVKVQ